MKIEEAIQVNESLLSAISKLLPQLSDTISALDRASLETIIKSDISHLFIASENDNICGMLTLVVYKIPTRMKALIEDVVVSESARGKGVGTSLIETAIQVARSKGAQSIDLTSRPSREAANRLYLRLGFQIRETNVYRYTVSQM